MSFRTTFVSGLLSLGVVAGAMAGATGQSQAGSLSKGEVAAIAGIGGLALGLGIASAAHGPEYYDYHRSPWEQHVERCYARYLTYDHRTDTYMGNDGYEHRCKL
ncbi:BA14K family protein [Mesorhizobium sp. ZMM04-5]|uniref:Lectin-like protein BA14k n=1 Tax=Mesorhizobium marinum TaxID=3228790 RepID=A0ABV3R0D5_9HYPH